MTGEVGLIDATVLATGDTGGKDALLPLALATDFAAATSAGFGVGTGAKPLVSRSSALGLEQML